METTEALDLRVHTDENQIKRMDPKLGMSGHEFSLPIAAKTSKADR